MQTFVIWLDGYLSAIGEAPTVEQTQFIKDKLDGLFEHVAEKPYKPTLPELGEQYDFPVHNGWPHNRPVWGSGEDDVVYRC